MFAKCCRRRFFRRFGSNWALPVGHTTALLRLRFSSFVQLSAKDALDELVGRELVAESYPSPLNGTTLGSLLEAYPKCCYLGVDPTSDSLHIGHLMVLLAVGRLYLRGFEVHLVIGNGTAKLGDPSGRSEDRTPMDGAVIENNTLAIKEQLIGFFDSLATYADKGSSNFSPGRLVIHFNRDWYDQVGLLDFTTEFCRRFRLGSLLRQRFVRERLAGDEGGLNFAEFSYQLFQAYDWYKLVELTNGRCRIQLGGQDQLGHFKVGRDALQKLLNIQSCGIGLRLLTASDGTKFGKSQSNVETVWLSGRKTTPFEFYQHLFRVPDFQVGGYLRRFTLLSLEHTEQLVERGKQETWLSQKALAEHVTKLVHGEEGLRAARFCTELLYGNVTDLLRSEVGAEAFECLRSSVPSTTESLSHLVPTSLTVLSLAGKLFANVNDAKVKVQQGAFSVNLERKVDPDEVMEPKKILIPISFHSTFSAFTLLRSGRRNYFLVLWTK